MLTTRPRRALGALRRNRTVTAVTRSGYCDGISLACHARPVDTRQARFHGCCRYINRGLPRQLRRLPAAADTGGGLRRNIRLVEGMAGQEAQQRDGAGLFVLRSLPRADKTQASRALKPVETAGAVPHDPQTLESRPGWHLPSLILATKSTRVLQFARVTMRTLSSRYPETAEHFRTRRNDRIHALYSMVADRNTNNIHETRMDRLATGHRQDEYSLPIWTTMNCGRNTRMGVSCLNVPAAHSGGREARGGAEGSTPGWRAAIDSELESGITGVAPPNR